MANKIDLLELMQTETAEKLAAFHRSVGYSLSLVNNQRVLSPVGDATLPEQGSELFITRIPKDAYEDELLPYLSIGGRVIKLRLMMSPSQLYSKGYAFVTYSSRAEASSAKRVLICTPFRGRRLPVELSKDNCRLFIGGIPDSKTKDEVWKSLLRIGMSFIVDVIMYRSYSDRDKNRGFVFVEFRTHQEAAAARTRYKNLRLWGENMHIDWSTPMPEVENHVMMKVKILFLRNLDVSITRRDLQSFLFRLLKPRMTLEKVYKFKDYAFIHFATRREAQHAMTLLREFFNPSDVEVCWAIPPMYAAHKTSQISLKDPNAYPIGTFDPSQSQANPPDTHPHSSYNYIKYSQKQGTNLIEFESSSTQRTYHEEHNPTKSVDQKSTDNNEILRPHSHYNYINYSQTPSFFNLSESCCSTQCICRLKCNRLTNSFCQNMGSMEEILFPHSTRDYINYSQTSRFFNLSELCTSTQSIIYEQRHDQFKNSLNQYTETMEEILRPHSSLNYIKYPPSFNMNESCTSTQSVIYQHKRNQLKNPLKHTESKEEIMEKMVKVVDFLYME